MRLRNVVIVAVAVIAILAIIGALLPKEQVLVEISGSYPPDTFIYKEFTVDEAGTYKVVIEATEGYYFWYVLNCTEAEFEAALDQEDLFPLTTRPGSQMTPGPAEAPPIEYEIELQPGTYVFAVVQTASPLGEVEFTAKIVKA